MQKIHLLPDYLIAKIAAGEVIERPAYAVKELIENSIDAKADQIKIELEDAGLKKIVVTDNGFGMSPQDLIESFKLHTTSKIKNVEHLIGIKSMGFRGEALASMAAVSNLTIQSRAKNSSGGNYVFIKNGVIERQGVIGIPIGTTVTIEHIFSKLPARKKYLKSRITELKNIIDIVSNSVLAYPNIRFTLVHNKKQLLDFPKTADLDNRLITLLGENFFQKLIPFSFEDSYLKIHGFISQPQFLINNTNKQYIFINNRRVNDKTISQTIKDVLGNFQNNKTPPAYLLFLDIPPELVDINVHPRKEQVSLSNSEFILEVIRQAILQTFSQQTPSSTKETKLTKSFAGKLLKEDTSLFKLKKDFPVNDLKQVQQFANLFILIPSRTGIILIDQHAAHERILYEQLTSEFKNKKQQNAVFKLSDSFTTELPFSESQLLKENLQVFQNLGFEIQEFGERYFKVLTVPQLFKDRDISSLINELLDDFETSQKIKDVDLKSNQMIKYLACRQAIKSGDKLTKKQMIGLVTKLQATDNNLTCPHGRPTKIEMSLGEINRMFKRF